MLKTKIHQWISAGAIALFLSLSAQVHATSYSQMVVFGDSLSDSGNIFDLFGGAFGPNPPYTQGRFTSNYSNGDAGLVWVEHLAGMLGLGLDNSLAGGTNYAFGGATASDGPADLVPSLSDQANFYFNDSAGTADANALYVVFGGGNDVRANSIGQSVSSISSVISELAAQGATSFFVPNLPDIGLTPESQAGAAPGGTAEVISAAAAQFNGDLAIELANLEATLGINIVSFDLFGIFNDILNDPGMFDVSNVTDACIGLDSLAACTDPDSYLFFDGIHPTAIVHQLMGELAFQALTEVPVPAALPLLLSALGVLGLRRRRSA